MRDRHIAVAMAKREKSIASMLPLNLLWPYDNNRHTMVSVARGPQVADELTRNLREPYLSMVRNQYRGINR